MRGPSTQPHQLRRIFYSTSTTNRRLATCAALCRVCTYTRVFIDRVLLLKRT